MTSTLCTAAAVACVAHCVRAAAGTTRLTARHASFQSVIPGVPGWWGCSTGRTGQQQRAATSSSTLSLLAVIHFSSDAMHATCHEQSLGMCCAICQAALPACSQSGGLMCALTAGVSCGGSLHLREQPQGASGAGVVVASQRVVTGRAGQRVEAIARHIQPAIPAQVTAAAAAGVAPISAAAAVQNARAVNTNLYRHHRIGGQA